jgi:hypothetical protein
MNFTADKHSEEIFNTLHNKKISELQTEGSEKLFDYLMDVQDLLKTNDLQEWKNRYEPKPEPSKTKKKRLRQSPNAFREQPLPPCIECNGDQVIEDVTEGQYVCMTCGLIQSRVVSMEARAHCSMDALRNRSRVYIHHYSRITYFWTVIRLLQGDTSPIISKKTLQSLRAEIGGKNVTVDTVKQILRQKGLSKKYRRHRWSIVRLLGGGQEFKWEGDVILKMMKMFRRIEYYWKSHKPTILKKRCTFFSYTHLIHEFLKELNLPAPNALLLKSHTLRRIQQKAYQDFKHTIEKQYGNNNKKT